MDKNETIIYDNDFTVDGEKVENKIEDNINKNMDKKSNYLGVISLVLGIFSIISPVIKMLLGISAIVTGIISNKREKSKKARAGIICGIIGIVFGIIFFILKLLLIEGLFIIGRALS